MHIHTAAGTHLRFFFSQICFPRDLKGLARIRETGEYLSNPHPQVCGVNAIFLLQSKFVQSEIAIFFTFFGSVEKEQAGKRLEAQSSSENNARISSHNGPNC